MQKRRNPQNHRAFLNIIFNRNSNTAAPPRRRGTHLDRAPRLLLVCPDKQSLSGHPTRSRATAVPFPIRIFVPTDDDERAGARQKASQSARPLPETQTWLNKPNKNETKSDLLALMPPSGLPDHRTRGCMVPPTSSASTARAAPSSSATPSSPPTEKAVNPDRSNRNRVNRAGRSIPRDADHQTRHAEHSSSARYIAELQTLLRRFNIKV